VELLDEDPMYDRFLRTLGSAGRLVVYDRLGMGSSDPIDPDRDWFTQSVEAYCAVLDAVEAEAAWIVGSALAAIAETIRARPDRVLGAVLVNPASRQTWRYHTDHVLVEDRRTSPEETARLFTPSRADDPAFVEWLRRASRLGTSKVGTAANAAANREAVRRFVAAARPIPGGPPTLFIRRRHAMSQAEFEWWMGIFPEAEHVTIEGADAWEMALDAGLIAELAVEFITGEPVAPTAQRSLVAVLFTDLVDSTPTAASSGDTVWRSTLDRYEAALQRTIQRHHGTVVKHTGDGALATFPSGTEAGAAGVEVRNTTRDLGLEGRTGIHLGEVERRHDDISGIAVNLAARIMGEAGPGEIVVSSSVEQTTVGGQFHFDDQGIRTLRGIDRPWQLVTVEAR
jgi:class 3 adenylate cyclase